MQLDHKTEQSLYKIFVPFNFSLLIFKHLDINSYTSSQYLEFHSLNYTGIK